MIILKNSVSTSQKHIALYYKYQPLKT